MSRGVTPMAFNPLATFSIVGISGITTKRAFDSFRVVSVRVVTAVDPVWLNAPGCDTSSVLAIEMVSSP